jgi:predicted NUDIX family phosphoesterase
MPSAEGELVLGVPRSLVMPAGGWRGVITDGLEPFLEAIAGEGTFRPRAEAEEDPTWKQVIPYLVMRDRDRIFLMRRTRAGGDARIHDRWTIGIGGHVNPDDGGIDAGLRREWSEELAADWDPEPTLIGLLNDDSVAIGRVHLGVVFAAETQGRPLAIRETHKLSGELVSPAGVLAVYEHLETWSQLLFDHLEGRAVASVG